MEPGKQRVLGLQGRDPQTDLQFGLRLNIGAAGRRNRHRRRGREGRNGRRWHSGLAGGGVRSGRGLWPRVRRRWRSRRLEQNGRSFLPRSRDLERLRLKPWSLGLRQTPLVGFVCVADHRNRRRCLNPRLVRPRKAARNTGKVRLEADVAALQRTPGVTPRISGPIGHRRSFRGDHEAERVVSSSGEIGICGRPGAGEVARAPADFGQIQHGLRVEVPQPGQLLEFRAGKRESARPQVDASQSNLHRGIIPNMGGLDLLVGLSLRRLVGFVDRFGPSLRGLVGFVGRFGPGDLRGHLGLRRHLGPRGFVDFLGLRGRP